MSDFRNLDVARWPQQVRAEWERETLDDTDSTPLEYLDESDDRVKTWRADEWHYVGVRAKVTLYVPIGGGSFATYQLTSPGLWGVESDSGEDYFAEIYADEKKALRDALESIGRAFAGTDQLTETDA